MMKTRVHPKVAAGALAGSVTVVLVWGLSLEHVDVPAFVASAITTILTFGAGYLTGGE